MRYKHMGQMIASLRKEKNYTQKELADTLGITDKAVSKWERGIAYPDILLIPKLAETLGVTTDILLSAAETSASSNSILDHLKSVSGKEWSDIVALCLKCVGIVLAAGCLLLNLLGSRLDTVGTLIILSVAVICIGISSFNAK